MDNEPQDAELRDEYEDIDNGWVDAPPSSDAAAQLQDLIQFLASNLVDDPENVEVTSNQRGGSVFVTLRVPESELGRVIGRQGRIARALRTALMIAGSRHHVRASLDIEG
ncbi:MAG: KH domain-containing protein [Chloroflexota bacterium]